MPSAVPDHYAMLGLDRDCTAAQIRDAYRLLAKQLHPDVNHAAETAVQIQALNAAYEILGDPAKRRAYDRQSAAERKIAAPNTGGLKNIAQEVHLRLEDFLRGARLEVRVKDPGNAGAVEIYPLVIPPETAPGARFRVPRDDGSFVLVRVKPLPDFRFKPRGSDLRCDLRISHQRATQGGAEPVRGLAGNFLRVTVPLNVARGEIVRLKGEGLPKTRGGRGDLLVRIVYSPQVRITRNRR